ncbi:hypothetical protein MSAN_01894700 [Mycena sanguinolenta]|uniref:Uncharacterized protein n=1 Tax=Mycena sanguinolenta TaxID=230812 RepID=A0A8H6XNT5_9AGAR|nr:hypothetical protein MSAN_01894700 [Mycena sanguinolenta]
MDQSPEGQNPSLCIEFLPGTKESYLAVFLECVVYGVYLPVFFECAKVLLRKNFANANHVYLVATTVSMFALISTRAINDIVGSTKNFDNPIEIVVQSGAFKIELLYALVVAIADAFIVFRTFIVWNRSWVITALPALLYLASCGTSVWSLVLLHHPGSLESILDGNVANAGDIFLILTVCTNLVCTSLISFRIFDSYRKLAPEAAALSRRSESILVASVLIESAAIYTLLSVGLLITTRLGKLASLVLSSVSSPMIGLVFSHIIVRVGRGTSYGAETGSTSSMEFSTQPPQHRSYELSVSRRTQVMAGTEVQISLDHNSQRGLDGVVPENSSHLSKYGEGPVV